MNRSDWNKSNLPWVLAEVPLEKREAAANAGVITVHQVTAWHVTESANELSIRRYGIKAASSKQSYDRPAAVYLFVIRDEIDSQTVGVLGIKNPVILEVTIPEEEVLTKLRWDGLFNAGFGTASAVQFLGNVPPEWINP